MHKILLVDDVKLLLEIQKKFLASSLVNILTACNGAEALDVATREMPDLIVMDKYMPIMDGIACCTTLKADNHLKHIPVIMVSNATNPSDIDEYNRAGCSAYLPKPLDGKAFLDTIKKFLPAIERRAVRVPVQIEVRLTMSGAAYQAMSEDITLGGIYVSSVLLVSADEELQLSFILPGSDTPTEATGRVVWVNRTAPIGASGLKPGFGIEFTRITGSGIPFMRIEELKKFIAAHS